VSAAVTCPECGQRGDERPGLRLGEFERLEAVFVEDGLVPTPQRIECRSCGHAWAVPRDSIEVWRPS
jgi:ribosomal protein L37AE/L43A